MSGTGLGPRDAMKQKHPRFMVGEWEIIFGTKEIGKTKAQRQENANQNVAVTLGKKRQGTAAGGMRGRIRMPGCESELPSGAVRTQRPEWRNVGKLI